MLVESFPQFERANAFVLSDDFVDGLGGGLGDLVAEFRLTRPFEAILDPRRHLGECNGPA